MAQREDNSLALQIQSRLAASLPDYLNRQRWFGGKARTIQAAEVPDIIPLPGGAHAAFLILAQINYTEGHPDTYALPLLLAEGDQIGELDRGGSVPCLHLKADRKHDEMVLYDALSDGEFPRVFLEAISSSRSFTGLAGKISASPTQAFRSWDLARADLRPSLMRAEQSNTSIRFGDRLILKFYRRLEAGTNPDLEIATFLTDKVSFQYAPPLGGWLEYRRPQSPPVTLGILQAFVPNQGDAWKYTLSSLDSYLESVPSLIRSGQEPLLPLHTITELAKMESPPRVAGTIGDYWDSAGLLGRRTAQLHLALASGAGDPNFRPEPLSPAFQQSQSTSMRNLASQVLRTLERRFATLSDSTQPDARSILKLEKNLLARFDSLAKLETSGELIRIHGDYHLGQVLSTGSDFVVIDFEGEPARPLEDRRAKRNPLRDVAGMLRSFHYAAYTALGKRLAEKAAGPEEDQKLGRWARHWQVWVSARFLGEYLKLAAQSHFLPQSESELATMLDVYLLDKALYELGYELNNRPDWVRLPLDGILQILSVRE